MAFSIVTKADSLFFEGLMALMGSLALWHPETQITVVDCGLEPAQARAVKAFDNVLLVSADLRCYDIPAEMRHYYTSAIYGFFSAPRTGSATIHLDADTVVLDRLDGLVDMCTSQETGICGVPDFPKLTLSFQIGERRDALRDVKRLVPELDLSSVSFNGGVFCINERYYVERMLPYIEALLPLHNRLWGNDMAVMNLAAFAANARRPFIQAPHVFNTRETYRRASTLRPNVISGTTSRGTPRLTGPFGSIRVLHFVGHSKPWRSGPSNDSRDVWHYYRSFANEVVDGVGGKE